jgi:hypothetical protein
MDINNLRTIYDKILSDIETTPESAYDNFEPLWKNLPISSFLYLIPGLTFVY